MATGTASNALSGRPSVAPELRARVIEAARKPNHRPNVVAAKRREPRVREGAKGRPSRTASSRPRPRICALSRERSSLRRPQAQVCPWHAFHCRSIAPKRPHTISSVRLWDGPAGRTSSLEEFEPNLHECRGIVRSRKRRPHVSVESQSPERRKTRTKAGAPEPRRRYAKRGPNAECSPSLRSLHSERSCDGSHSRLLA